MTPRPEAKLTHTGSRLTHTDSRFTHTESRLTRTGTGFGSTTHTRYTSTRAGALIDAVVWSVRARRAVVAGTTASVRWVSETVTPAGWLVVTCALVLLPLGLLLGWA